jgi:hypothetical protein
MKTHFLRQGSSHDKIFVMFQAPLAKFSAVTALLVSVSPVSAQRAVVHEKDIAKTIVGLRSGVKTACRLCATNPPRMTGATGTTMPPRCIARRKGLH